METKKLTEHSSVFDVAERIGLVPELVTLNDMFTKWYGFIHPQMTFNRLIKDINSNNKEFKCYEKASSFGSIIRNWFRMLFRW